MKKRNIVHSALSLSLTAALCLSMAACGGTQTPADSVAASQPSAPSAVVQPSAAETTSAALPVKALNPKQVEENPYMAKSDANIHHDGYNTDSTDEILPLAIYPEINVSYETTNANASPAIYFDSYGHAVVPLLGGIAIRDLNAEETKTLGYFSPTLFSRVMPNFKNKESAAQITGAESPLYLEDPSSLILPPWNDIDDSKSQMYASDNQSVPYSIKMRITDDLQTYAESTGDSRFYTYNNQLQDPYVYIDMSDLYVRSIIEPFLKGCTINDNMQFSGYMHTYDPNDNFSTLPKYIYAQNVTVNTKEGRDFLVDFVFTPISGIPLYVHATEIDAATAAFPEDSEFFNLVITALFVATHAEADADEFTSQVESYYTSDKYTSLIASFYDFPAHLFSFPPDTTPEEDWRVELLVDLRDSMYDMLYNFVYSIDSASSIDYRDESLIVLRNEIGYTMTVFYDAISESITGYGLDPSNPDVYRAEPFLFGETAYQGAYVYDG